MSAKLLVKEALGCRSTLVFHTLVFVASILLPYEDNATMSGARINGIFLQVQILNPAVLYNIPRFKVKPERGSPVTNAALFKVIFPNCLLNMLFSISPGFLDRWIAGWQRAV